MTDRNSATMTRPNSPKVWKNRAHLRHELIKSEPASAKRQPEPRVVFGVNMLPFDETIPILCERHLDAYFKRLAESNQAANAGETRQRPLALGPPPVPQIPDPSPKHKKIPKLVIKTPTPPKGKSDQTDSGQGSFYCASPRLSMSSDEESIQTPRRSKKQQLQEDTPPSPPAKRRPSFSLLQTSKAKLIAPPDAPKVSDLQSKTHRISQDRVDQIVHDLASDSSDDAYDSDPGAKPDEEPSAQHEPACGSSIDKLIISGPEEDEFRQYDNDENEEGESTISKNLKKIRTESTKHPAPPKPSVPLRPPLIQQPFQKNRKDKSPPPAQPQPSQPTSVKQIKTSPRPEPPTEITPEYLERSVGQKDWRLIYTEMDRNMSTFKTNEIARVVLKKAVIACLDNDETYELINFMRLVFEFEYPEDTSFWEMLIGRLKRKVNPHTTDYRFKCEVDPKFVINNYNLVLQDILKHFNSSSRMSNVRIAFHLAAYLAIWGHEKESAPTRQTSAPTTALIQPMPPVKIDAAGGSTGGSQDPTASLDVSLVKTANGQMHFKIKSARRESKFCPKFL